MVKMIVTKIKRRNILPIYIRCGVLYIYICHLHLMHMFYNLELHKCKRSNNVYCKSCVCIYICILFLVCCEVEICSDFQRKKTNNLHQYLQLCKARPFIIYFIEGYDTFIRNESFDIQFGIIYIFCLLPVIISSIIY